MVTEKAHARETYERRVATGLYQTQEALQDSMLGLKEAMDAVMKAEGKKVVTILPQVTFRCRK
jgi:hypothetical protein